jgi:hypothetical protein
MKAYLTPEEAISLLPNDECVHTFYNAEFGLVGADWSKQEIIEKLNAPGMVIELTGEMARGMKHGMCVYSESAKYLNEVLFVETDEEKLLFFEKEAKAAMLGGEA